MADTAITIAKSRVNIESNPERLNGYTNKYNVQYSDISYGSGSTDTVTLTLGTTPALWVCKSAVVNVTTAFAGTGALTIKVGTSGTADAFIAATSVLSAGLIQATNGAGSVNTPASSTSTSAATMKAVFTNATSGSPSALTAGALDIYLELIDLSRLT